MRSPAKRVTGIAPEGELIAYTTGGGTSFAGGVVTRLTRPQEVAELMLAAMPGVRPEADDPDYVSWYAGMLYRAELTDRLPIAWADSMDTSLGWEIGGDRYPLPPEIPGAPL